MHDEQSFEEMYRATDALWSGRPNAQLVAEAADLPPGTALDVGCGEGADAIWLAERGWQVTGVDFAATALERAAAHAAAAGAEVAARIDWVHADVTRWTPDRGASTSSPRSTCTCRRRSAGRCSPGWRPPCAPGGTLLIVGHDFSDVAAGAHRPPEPDRFFTAAGGGRGARPRRVGVLVPRRGHGRRISMRGRTSSSTTPSSAHDAGIDARQTSLTRCT